MVSVAAMKCWHRERDRQNCKVNLVVLPADTVLCIRVRHDNHRNGDQNMSEENTQDADRDDWEEVDAQEVELAITALERLIDTIQSETIQAELQVASDNISELADWEEDEDDQAEAA